jgi:AcrR family transcriptional regulator
MAQRTVKEHDERRMEILMVSRSLFYSKGFAGTTVQDIIDACGIAKGTFYYYFKSKLDLLDALISSLTASILEAITPLLKADMNAVDKMNALLEKTRSVKLEQKELLIAALEVLYDDENILYRYKMFRRVISEMHPVYAQVIQQGIDEGVFDTPDPEETASLILHLLMGKGEEIAMQLIGAVRDPSMLKQMKRSMNMLRTALIRILKAPENCFSIYDFEKVREFAEVYLNAKRGKDSL